MVTTNKMLEIEGSKDAKSATQGKPQPKQEAGMGTPRQKDNAYYQEKIAKFSSFLFYSSRKNGQQTIYKRLKELNQSDEGQLNELVVNSATPNQTLQIIFNTPNLLDKINPQGLALHIEKFSAIAEHLIEHPKKASGISNFKEVITQCYPELVSRLNASPDWGQDVANQDVYRPQPWS